VAVGVGVGVVVGTVVGEVVAVAVGVGVGDEVEVGVLVAVGVEVGETVEVCVDVDVVVGEFIADGLGDKDEDGAAGREPTARPPGAADAGGPSGSASKTMHKAAKTLAGVALWALGRSSPRVLPSRRVSAISFLFSLVTLLLPFSIISGRGSYRDECHKPYRKTRYTLPRA